MPANNVLICGSGAVSQDYIPVVESEHKAQPLFATDCDDSQISAFHPRAMQQAHENRIADAREIAIIILAAERVTNHEPRALSSFGAIEYERQSKV
jgi:hypothetical protein